MTSKTSRKAPRYEQDFNSLWKITGEVDDYFRRLGGAGCYLGFADWHVPALVLLLLSGVDPGTKEFLQSEESSLIDPTLWRSTDNLPIRTKERLCDLKLSPGLFHLYLTWATKRISEISKEPEHLLDWMRFMTENNERFRPFYR
jgi:hypothetical protein